MQRDRVIIKNLTQRWMNEITSHLNVDVRDLEARYFRLNGEECLAYELLSRILKKNSKVFAHHLPSKRYNFICTKGEAYFMVFWYNKRRSVMLQDSMQHIIHESHKQTI